MTFPFCCVKAKHIFSYNEISQTGLADGSGGGEE
jgi:hypothetical protein